MLDILRDGPRTTTELVDAFPRLTRFGVMKTAFPASAQVNQHAALRCGKHGAAGVIVDLKIVCYLNCFSRQFAVCRIEPLRHENKSR
jgi:hypothetical protein